MGRRGRVAALTGEPQASYRLLCHLRGTGTTQVHRLTKFPYIFQIDTAKLR
jgi:hypothetical protein